MSNEIHPHFRRSEGDGRELLRFGARLKVALLKLDEMLARVCLSVAGESGSLLIFLFHGLFQDSDEARAGVMDPHVSIPVFPGHQNENPSRLASRPEIGLSGQSHENSSGS